MTVKPQELRSYSEADVVRLLLLRGLSHDYKRVIRTLIQGCRLIVADEEGEVSRVSETIDLSIGHLKRTAADLDSISNEIDSGDTNAASSIAARHRRKIEMNLDQNINVLKHIDSYYQSILSATQKNQINKLIMQSQRAKRQIGSLFNLPFKGEGFEERQVSLRNEANRIYDDLAGLRMDLDLEDKIQFINELTSSVHASRLLFTICISNLIANALVHSRRKTGLVITISDKILENPDSNSRGLVEVTVSDNGVGIDPKEHKKIFKLFEQGRDDSDKDGSGVGLPFAQKAAELMGGSLSLIPTENGARFSVHLPIAKHGG